jgi:hypothetical protein
MSALDPAQQSTETIYDRLGGFDAIVAVHRRLVAKREMPQRHW